MKIIYLVNCACAYVYIVQASAALVSMGVMAEEMSKERKEVVRLKNKSKTKDGKHGKKSDHTYSLPDPSEAIEKRAAKYEELYDKALQEIQV